MLDVELVSRSQWGARPPKSVSHVARSDGMSWHYTGGNLSAAVERADFGAVAAWLRSIQNMHMDSNYLTPGGGSDYGYSFTIDQLGRIWTGRGWGVAGGHTMGANHTCHGTLFLVSIEQRPSQAAIESARWLKAEHDRRYGVGWSKGHREVAGNPSGTSCPGGPILELIHAGAFEPGFYVHEPEDNVPKKKFIAVDSRTGEHAVFTDEEDERVHIASVEAVHALMFAGVEFKGEQDWLFDCTFRKPGGPAPQ